MEGAARESEGRGEGKRGRVAREGERRGLGRKGEGRKRPQIFQPFTQWRSDRKEGSGQGSLSASPF